MPSQATLALHRFAHPHNGASHGRGELLRRHYRRQIRQLHRCAGAQRCQSTAQQWQRAARHLQQVAAPRLIRDLPLNRLPRSLYARSTVVSRRRTLDFPPRWEIEMGEELSRLSGTRTLGKSGGSEYSRIHTELQYSSKSVHSLLLSRVPVACRRLSS